MNVKNFVNMLAKMFVDKVPTLQIFEVIVSFKNKAYYDGKAFGMQYAAYEYHGIKYIKDGVKLDDALDELWADYKKMNIGEFKR